ncbi:hypothetical protein SAMN05216597_3472 [Pseudomonas cannabina]|nr:hypothetical protein SAMN05216597_3472 [Pseudomonas cannabina]
MARKPGLTDGLMALFFASGTLRLKTVKQSA